MLTSLFQCRPIKFAVCITRQVVEICNHWIIIANYTYILYVVVTDVLCDLNLGLFIVCFLLAVEWTKSCDPWPIWLFRIWWSIWHMTMTRWPMTMTRWPVALLTRDIVTRWPMTRDPLTRWPNICEPLTHDPLTHCQLSCTLTFVRSPASRCWYVRTLLLKMYFMFFFFYKTRF